MLSDVDIREEMMTGEIVIDPFDERRLQPASYDLLLGYDFLLFDNTKATVIDPKTSTSDYMRKVSLKHSGEYIVLHPKEFILGVSFEKVGVSNRFACELMGKSSLARLGLIVHTTAGFIDPGNELRITLEMVNFNTVPLKLYPKMKIAQVAFYELRTPCEKPYGHPDLNSKYYKSETVRASEMIRNFLSDD